MKAGLHNNQRFDFRLRRRRAACCLRERGFTNPPIGEALAADALQGIVAAFNIANTKLSAIVVAEIELGEVAEQVLLSAVLVDAFHAALEDREEAFNRVGVNAAADIFAGGVLDRLMGRKLGAGLGVEAAFVGVEDRRAANVGDDDLADRGRISAIDVEGANRATALDQRDDRALATDAGLPLRVRLATTSLSPK